MAPRLGRGARHARCEAKPNRAGTAHAFGVRIPLRRVHPEEHPTDVLDREHLQRTLGNRWR